MRRSWAAALLALLCASPAVADETSTGDKLRILYANRFTFTDDGLPLVTVEIVGGRDEVTLGADGGLVVRPDGEGGSAVAAKKGSSWTIRAEHTTPASVQEWTVVERLTPDDATGITDATARWTDRGFEPHAFEIGTVFGVDGEVIDTRETLIAVDPVASPGGTARAAKIAKKYGVATTVHRELVARPSGTIVAESADGTRVENPSVLWFQPRDATHTISVDDVPVSAGGSQLDTSTETRRYWGSVYVTLDEGGKLVAVNAVAEDKLLDGLVPAEIFPDSPEEALEAQAIAARTELLQKIGRRNLTDPFLLCSTQQCQVYAGAGHEDARTTKAVEKTRGVVILRDGGGLADIRYSASCGGHGEDNDVIWGGDPDPSLRGKSDETGKAKFSTIDDDNIEDFLDQAPERTWCGRATMGKKNYRWTQEVAAADLDALVAKEYPEVGKVRSLEPVERGRSGRIRSLTIVGSKHSVTVDGDLHIRRLLGGLKSTLFVVEVDGKASAPTRFRFRGAGFGHGVGMCQVGAIGMAEGGKSHEDILSHYFRGTHLHQLY